MYNFYNLTAEKHSAWRNAYEIKAAALEHEKRRFQMTDGDVSLARPQGHQQTGWAAIFKAPLRLLATLMG